MAPGDDHQHRRPHGLIIIREGGDQLPWLVTWLPDDTSAEEYPGFTVSSRADVPAGPTVDAVLAWALKQPWATPD